MDSLIGTRIAFKFFMGNRFGDQSMEIPEAKAVKDIETSVVSEEASANVNQTQAPAIVHYISRRKKHPAELDTSKIDPNAWLDS